MSPRSALVLPALLLAFAGCGGEQSAAPSTSESGAESQPASTGREKSIELAYVEWASEVASTHVVAAVLADELGYQVELTPVAAGIMWQAMATGDADAMVAAWLPSTHEHYLEDVQDKVVDLGPNLDGTKVGLVVPQYVTIDSIAEMNDHADKFGGKIYGIDSGAGIMSTTETALTEYGLGNFELQDSSDAAMTVVLGEKYKANEWVVVTGWTPHWKFATYDLKYLDDPKGLYGGAEQIHTIVRQGLEADMPEAYAFLDAFTWEPADMEQVMVWNEEDGSKDPYATARRWISENRDQVDAWLGR